MLRDARCPQCGSALRLKVLWDFSRHSHYGLVSRFGTLNGHVGLACPNCGLKLRVVQIHIRVFLFLSLVVLLGLAAYVGIWLRARRFPTEGNAWVLVGLALAYIALLWLYRTLIPHLARVRPVRSDEHVAFPLSSAYDGPITGSLLDSAESASNNRWRVP